MRWLRIAQVSLIKEMASGKLVILAIMTVAVAAAGFAWWYQYQRGRESLAYWGSEGAYLIHHAPNVELLKLGRSEKTANQETVLGATVLTVRELSQVPGLTHARQALITDASFDWQASPHTSPTWEYALRFREGERSLTIAFDLTAGYAQSLNQERPIRLVPTFSQGLQKFLADHASHQEATELTRP